MKNNEKDEIYNLIFENRYNYKFIRMRERLENNDIFLDLLFDLDLYDKLKKYVEEINIHNVRIFLSEHWLKKCDNINCNNYVSIRNMYTWPPNKNLIHEKLNKSEEFNKVCSKKCRYDIVSQKQSGSNNTCHRMTAESKASMCSKNSIKMKEHIKNGTFKPCITNSWAGSMVTLNIDNNYIDYRSSWDAFFHLCNQHLEYEKLVIEYKYKDNYHNYITDFVDHVNKKVYEIKPDSNLAIGKNLAKFEAATKWANENNYEFIIIGNDWFSNNYSNYKYLLDTQDEENKNKIVHRLKQFNNED